MSIVQACVDAESAVRRARSLFGATGGIEVPNSATEITGAIQTATAGRDRTLEMAGGAGMPAYRAMVDRSIPPLTTASTSDAGLTTQLVTAAAVTKAGATQLDAVAAQTRTLSAAAPAARTAADQRAILTALRAQMQQASQVVQTTQQQAGAAANQIETLKYPNDNPAERPDDQILGDTDPAGAGRVQAVDFKQDGPQPTPGPQPFLPAYEQALTAPPAPAPPSGPPQPFSPPQTPPVPPAPLFSPACQAAAAQQQDDVVKKILADMGKGAVLGGLAGVTVDGVGALPGLIAGGAIGGIGGVIDWATSSNPLPPQCK
jgi:hypothetical protein